jgi:hypothetical protein
VTVEYRVSPTAREAFLSAVENLQRERRRDGAYLISAIGAFLVGYLHTVTGSWVVPCWCMATAGIVAAVAGAAAVRPVYIEDISSSRSQ